MLRLWLPDKIDKSTVAKSVVSPTVPTDVLSEEPPLDRSETSSET